MIINFALALIITPFLLRHLNQEEYGYNAILNQFVGYLALLDFGMAASISRQIALVNEGSADFKIRLNRIISTGFFFSAFVFWAESDMSVYKKFVLYLVPLFALLGIMFLGLKPKAYLLVNIVFIGFSLFFMVDRCMPRPYVLSEGKIPSLLQYKHAIPSTCTKLNDEQFNIFNKIENILKHNHYANGDYIFYPKSFHQIAYLIYARYPGSVIFSDHFTNLFFANLKANGVLNKMYFILPDHFENIEFINGFKNFNIDLNNLKTLGKFNWNNHLYKIIRIDSY